MASERKLTVVIAGDSRGATKAIGDVEKKAGGFGSKIGGLSTKAKVAFAGLGAGALAFAGDSISAYAEAEEAQKRLGDAFERFPRLADSSQGALQKINSELQKKTKYDDDAIASGQAVIAQFGLTGRQIESVTPLLLDYASRTGKDIPAAGQDLGKALLGNAKALKNIGIKYTATGDTAQDFANISALLRQQVGGFAEKEGTTAAGKAAILKNQFGELQETVGSKLVPALNSLASAGLKALGWLENPVVRTGVVILAGLATAIVGVNLATRGWTAASAAWQSVQKVGTAVQWAFNAALTANPIGLVVAGIAALAAGVFIAYKKVGWFHDAVDAGWQALQRLWDKALGAAAGVRGALSGAFEWVKGHWPLLLGILTGPFGLAAVAVIRHRDTILNAMKRVPGFIAAFFSRVAGTISSPFSAAFSAIRSMWNSTVGGFGFSVPSWVPKVGGKSFHIPTMHTGGIFDPGAKEGFALLKRKEGVFTPEQMKALAPVDAVSASSGAPEMHVTVDLRGAVVASGIEFQAIVEKAVRNVVSRKGYVPGTNIVRTSVA